MIVLATARIPIWAQEPNLTKTVFAQDLKNIPFKKLFKSSNIKFFEQPIIRRTQKKPGKRINIAHIGMTVPIT